MRTVSTAGLSSSPDPDDVLALDGTSGNKPLCLEEKLVSIKVENSFTLLRFGYLQEEDDYKVIRCFRIYDKPFVDIDSYELEDFGETTTPLIYSNKDAHIPTPSITNKPETRTTEQRLYISHPKDQNFVSDFGGVSPIKKAMAEDLVLDTAIRDWVLIPLTIVMILIGILRYFVSKLMQSQQTPDAKVVKEGQVVVRARNLRAGANFIPAKSFRARRAYFSNEENGLLHVPKGQGQNPQAQMFSDPNMAMDMMKKNLSMIIPQTLTFAWVNFFFSGFVAAKIPFPLTQRFRSMLQNGIDLSTVDVSYVSSRSWYFLNLFGLRGLFSLILGEENAMDDTQRMMQMGGFGFDPTKVLRFLYDRISHESPLIFQKTITLPIEGLQMALEPDLVIDRFDWWIVKGILQSGIFKTKGDDSLDVAPGQRNFLSTGPRFAMVGWVWSVLDMSGSSISFCTNSRECQKNSTYLMTTATISSCPFCSPGHSFAPQSLSAEKDGLDIIQHEWALPKFEQRAEAVLKKLVS
ncbi:hypothetical protein DKX38_023278 [Salix brachista]|uniref:ER membrane protein complex subunit 3 n=1 Tax=Salix brachista TaxID=2182728 RepID=A0A5N5JIJ1_9ROSI|nr:hypothetical protein DKX38_023278 [Salix brachista]